MIKTAYRLGRNTVNAVYGLSKSTVGAAKKAAFKNSVYAYWWNKKKNFGDLITPHLFHAYGLKAIHKTINDAEVISTGSILQRADGEKYNGYILGSGIIKDQKMSFPNANILAVRGVMTAERINAPAEVVLGDPGILISELINKPQKKEYRLGIVPHFQDKNQKQITDFIRKNKDEVLFIDVENTPKYVAKEISKCENIISSSLHGLITADSLGIPNLRIKVNEIASGGGDFKFEDYNSGINKINFCHFLNGREIVDDIIEMTDINYDEIQRNKKSMEEVILKMKNLLFG